LLFQIPIRERTCISEVATSEASFSSEYTMSSCKGLPVLPLLVVRIFITCWFALCSPSQVCC
jgi:hypothetical protein